MQKSLRWHRAYTARDRLVADPVQVFMVPAAAVPCMAMHTPAPYVVQEQPVSQEPGGQVVLTEGEEPEGGALAGDSTWCAIG